MTQGCRAALRQTETVPSSLQPQVSPLSPPQSRPAPPAPESGRAGDAHFAEGAAAPVRRNPLWPGTFLERLEF